MYRKNETCRRHAPKWAMIGLLLAISFSAADGSPSHSAEISGSELSREERRDVELKLERKLRACIASQQRIDGQSGHPSVRVRFQPEGNRLKVDIGRGFVPSGPTQAFREQLAELNEMIYWYLDLIAVVDWDFRFNGKEIQDVFAMSVNDLVRGIPTGNNPCANRGVPRKS